MATILDELIVTLGLSSKGFDSGAASAQKKLEGIEGAGAKAAASTKKVGEESESAAKSLGNLGAKMASFLALIGGSVAIKAFIKDTIETNTQLYFMSRNLDMSVQGLYALGAAAQEIGIGKGSLQQLAAQLKQIPGQLLAGQTPTLLPLLARAGIRFDQSPQQIMAGLARYFATMPANIALGLGTSYGLSYDQMTFLLQGVQKVQAAFDRDRAFAPTGAQAKRFAEMKQQIVDVGLAFTKLGYDLASKATPFLEKVFGLLMRFADWAQSHEKIVASFLAALAVGIGAVSIAIAALSIAMIGINPIVLAVVAAITALSAAITYLAQDYADWAKGATSTFDWTAFEKNVTKASHAWTSLKENIEGATDAFEKWLKRHGVNLPDSAIGKAASWYWNHFTLPGLLGIKINTAAGKALEGKQTLSAQDIENYFVGRGYSKAWAAAMAANAMAESGGKVGAVGDQGTSFGLFQIHSQAYKDAFRKLYGHDISTANASEQLDFASGIVQQMGIKTGEKVAPFFAGAMISNLFERPKNKAGEANARGRAASSLMDQMRNAGAATHSSNTHTDNSVTNNVGTVNIHGNGQTASITPGMARGMDWTTILMQGNYGLTG